MGPHKPDRVDAFVNTWAGQSPHVSDDAEGLTARLRLTLRHLDSGIENAWARTVGLSMTEVSTLQALVAAEGALSAGDLARQTRSSASGMTGVVRRLGEAGLVTRNSDTGDGRRVVVRLTPEGRSAWLAAVEQSVAVQEQLYGALTTSERQTLRSITRKLFTHAEEIF